MSLTLVIMAAGMGTRFKQGIKQFEPVGPNGEIIADYSIYDAKKAGFSKVIFIIRKDIEDIFKTNVGNRISKIIDVEYVFQEITDVPRKYKNIKRNKPWGTGQAILCVKNIINEPFLVINADDFYGYDSYKKIADYLKRHNNYCMVGFSLKNTISENGSVNRGICKISEDLYLNKIEEYKNIEIIDNNIVGEVSNNKRIIDENACTSMNMWGFTPSIFKYLEIEWLKFLDNMSDELNDEFFLPNVIDYLIKNNLIAVKVLKTNSKWLGMTYKSDQQKVKDEIIKLINEGVYEKNLYNIRG